MTAHGIEGPHGANRFEDLVRPLEGERGWRWRVRRQRAAVISRRVLRWLALGLSQIGAAMPDLPPPVHGESGAPPDDVERPPRSP